MSKTATRIIVVSLSLALVACQLPRIAFAKGSFHGGTPTSGQAANASHRGSNNSEPDDRAVPLAFGAFAHMSTSSDSTGLEFPDEDGDHVKRDVAVFLVISAFVAIFFIKVFLEGDEATAEDNTPPRPAPPTPSTISF